MKSLSKEKTQQLVLVVLLTTLALAGLGYFMVKPLYNKSQSLVRDRVAAQQRLAQVKQTIETADQIEAQLCESKKQLDHIEETMASGDLYSWAINTIRQFKLPYKLDIPQYSQIDGPKEMTMLPAFPYKQAIISVGGTAQFNDFGRFVADFENRFPHMRILNVSLEPVSALVGNEKERLAFRMEIAALVRPGAS
jgi:hypothetical protein